MAEKKIKIVRKDIMNAGYHGNLESVYVHNAQGEMVDTSNGVFVKLEGLMEGHREMRKAVLASEADKAGEILMIHNSETMYDERLNKLEDFYISAGEAARAYRLVEGDIITLTVDLFADAVEVGDVLVVKANGLLGQETVAGEDGADVKAKIQFRVIEDSGHQLHRKAKAFAVQVERN